MKKLRLETAGSPKGWLSCFARAGKGLLALWLLLFSFAVHAKDKPFYASKDYFHWADLLSAWDNGNLSKNKSAYKEGDVVPHAYVPEGLQTNQSYSVILKYDYLLSTKNAGGFIDLVWDPALFSKSPTGQLGEGSLTTKNKTFNDVDYYATDLSITGITAMPNETSGNTTLKVWKVDFTYTGTNGTGALYFGLQLAKAGDVATNGAAAWSGASLQTYLDPSSDPGTRSLQIDPGAILSACPNPPTVDAGSYDPLCKNGSPINLTQGTPTGGTWTGEGVSFDAVNNVYTFDPSVGTQTLIYTYTDGNGCANSDETTITVNDPPVVNGGTYGPLCENGSPIALAGTPSGGIWEGTGVSGSQGAGYTFDPSAGSQTLTYTYTDPNTGCSAAATVSITVNDPPVLSLPTLDPICSNAGTTVNLSDAAGLSPAGGTWSGQGVSQDGNGDYIFNPSGLSGSIQLTYSYTDPATNCTNSGTVNITVNEPPVISLPTFDPVCSNGGTIDLSAANGLDPAGGTWSGTGVQQDGKTFDPTGLSGTIQLTYSYTDATSGCSGSATTSITVNDPPTVGAGTYGPLCSNGSAIALGGTPAGGTWSGTGVSGDQTNGYTFNPAVGTQTLMYSYTDPTTHCTATATVEIVVNEAPSACGFTQTAPTLNGNPVIPQVGQLMKFRADNAGYTYEWTIGASGNTANASVINGTGTSQEVELMATSAGTFTLVLKITDAATGCSTTCQQTITVSPSGPFTTYTKGFWGTAGGAFCGGTGSDKLAVLNWMYSVVPVEGQTFGSLYKFTLKREALENKGTTNKPKAQIWQLLPGGSTPNKLTGNASSAPNDGWGYVPIETNTKSPNYGSIKNNLLAQGIAMFFNLKKDPNLGQAILYGNKLTFTGTACAGGTVTTQTIPYCVYEAAKNADGMVTVQGIYDVAMKVLGADPAYAYISASDANAALNALNVGFDKGANITGVEMTVTACMNVSPAVVRKRGNMLEVTATKLSVSAFPNPFTDRIRFTIQSPKAGRAVLEVYNMLGQKLAVPFEGQLGAGESRTVEYMAPANHRSSLIYRLRMNDEQISGKLTGTKQ